MSRDRCIFATVLLYIFLVPGTVLAFWPTPQADPQRTCRSVDAGPEGKGERWVFEGINVDTSMAVSRDGIVYTVSRDLKTLYAIDGQGQAQWGYTYKDGRLSQPSLGPFGTVYSVASGKKSYLVAVDTVTGIEKWRALVSPLTSESWLSHIAVAKDGRIYAAAGNHLAAFIPNGTLEWSHEFAYKAKWRICNSGPALSPDENVIYVYKRCGGGLFAFNRDGTLRWRDESEYKSDYSPPVVGADGTVFIPDGTTSAIHAMGTGGKRRWKASFPGMDLQPTVLAIGGDGTLYATLEAKKGGKIAAIDPKDGKVRWEFVIKAGKMSLALVVDKNGKLYYAADDGTLYVLNHRGKLLWKYFIRSKEAAMRGISQIHTNAAISGGIFYVIGMDGVLHAVGK